jgi:type III secretion protein N (ATPase)
MKKSQKTSTNNEPNHEQTAFENFFNEAENKLLSDDEEIDADANANATADAMPSPSSAHQKAEAFKKQLRLDYQKHLNGLDWIEERGQVIQIVGTIIEGKLSRAKLGDLCELIVPEKPDEPILVEVVGFTDKSTLMSALNSLDGVANGTAIRPLRQAHCIDIGPHLLGMVLDGFGRPLFKAPAARDMVIENPDEWPQSRVQVIREALDPTKRPRVTEALHTGVKVVDSLLTLGRGQRVGVFAGAGCGKTTILAAMARGADVDIIVFGLIGERGRELREFLEHELDENLVRKSILVCATSDKTSMERSRAAFTATAIAEAFRDKGKRVLLMLDSLTRFARAQREIGLAAGEPPAKGGFPPSVYTMLPRLIERAGNSEEGTMTALYTVLVEGDNVIDPIGEEARSLLDGHIILARKLAEQGHFPAVDVLASISRTMANVIDEGHRTMANRFRELMARYKELELLIRLGEYKKGTDPFSDIAVELNPQILKFLKQDTRYPLAYKQSFEEFKKIVKQSDGV